MTKEIQVDFHRANTTVYQVTNNRLRSRVHRLQKKLANMQNKFKCMQEKFDNSPEIGKIKKINEAAAERNQKAVYLLDQIHNFDRQKPQWSELSIRYCVVWRSISPKGYEHARASKLISAPSRSTLNRYVGTVDGDSGISSLIKKRLQAECENLEQTEKIVSLIGDEMSIKERLLYDRTSDEFFGVVSAEGVYDTCIGRDPKLANKLLCFVVNGLCKKFTIPAAYFLLEICRAMISSSWLSV